MAPDRFAAAEVGERVPGRARAGPGAWLRARRRWGINEGLLFIAPAVLLYALFVAFPAANTLLLSLYDWDGLSPARRFVGLENFVALLTSDRYFRIALRNNAYWALISIPAQIALGFGLAVLLDQRLPLRTLYRTVFFLPATISSVVIAAVWSWLYNPELGLINASIRWLGFSSFKVGWLGDPTLAIFAAIAVNVWRWTGFAMVLYLAALQVIPTEIHEAAIVDGAGWWRRVWSIDWPLVAPTTAMLAVLGIIGAMREFELVYILTKGGPAHQSDLLALQVFNQAFTLNRSGYGASISVVLLALTLVLTLAQFRLYRRYQGGAL